MVYHKLFERKKFQAYWASTSSNGLVNQLIRTSQSEVKEMLEELLNDHEIVVNFDEQIVFDQLETKENAIWSLMVASGYLEVAKIEYRSILRTPWYHLKITNLETFSSFDTGNHPSGRTMPERFYHGFVLGLLVELRDQYELKSNRESGYGRYDVMLIPRERKKPAFVLEFKVLDPDEENGLADTVQSALRQIEDKHFDAELIERGIARDDIKHYGLAFEGKKVLIGN
ncbi:PD-(D/E)XK nuclease domain-containing protein [Dorea sp.]